MANELEDAMGAEGFDAEATLSLAHEDLVDFLRHTFDAKVSLERQLEEANDSIHAMHSDCSGFVVQIGSLESERDTLKSALIQRNAQLGVACLKHDLIHALECAGCYREIQSERDAALDQVVALRCLIDDFFNYVGGADDPRLDDHLMDRAVDALTDTQALANQRVEAIRREAVEEAAERVSSKPLAWMPIPAEGIGFRPEALRAAILGEKENN